MRRGTHMRRGTQKARSPVQGSVTPEPSEPECPATTTLMVVTPALAEQWLGRPHPSQRPIRKAHVARLARDMTNGTFRVTPDPIVITQSGYLSNGQHRLRAVLLANVTVTMSVATGWRDDVYAVLDGGKPRTIQDRAEVPWMKRKNAMATVRSVMAGFRDRRTADRTEAELVEFGTRHETVLEYLSALPHATKSRAAVMAVCARALIAGEDQLKVERFFQIVGSGVGDGQKESAAVRLFAYVHSPEVRGTGGGGIGHINVYRRTQTALQAFLAGRPLTLLRPLDRELWPLPEDP